tara:strand:- start:47 stop:364 length:318 start_codon:yes stop_codon:yes gene_type:complete
MKNAINNQFKMNPGSKEVDTEGTFKNDAAVLNMGHPTNYGSPLADKGHKGDDKKHTHEKKKKKNPANPKRPLNPFSKEYTGFTSGSNPYIRTTSPQKSEAGTIFE